MATENQILLYQAEDGETRLEVLHQDETVWLTQRGMAELFQKAVNTINEHIKQIYREGELREGSTIRNFRIVQREGNREVTREVAHYSLDMIISVGYRVNSYRGTQFRIWATQKLREFIVKGFVMDDDRLDIEDEGVEFVDGWRSANAAAHAHLFSGATLHPSHSLLNLRGLQLCETTTLIYYSEGRLRFGL